MSKEIKIDSVSNAINTSNRGFPGNIHIDYEALQECLKDYDGTEDEKKELIDITCWMMLTFVDLGYGIEPTQQALQVSHRKIISTALPFLDVIMDSDIADEFNSTTQNDSDIKVLEEGVIE